MDSIQQLLEPLTSDGDYCRPSLDSIKAQAQRRRRIRSAILLPSSIILLIGVFALIQRAPGGTTTSVAPGGATTSVTSDEHVPAAAPFVPPTIRDGDLEHAEVRLLDGSKLLVSYPVELGFAQLGFRSEGYFQWPVQERVDPTEVNPCCGRSLDVHRGTISDVSAGREPTEVYPGWDGSSVSFFEGDEPSATFLAFQFGSWVVTVWDYPEQGEYSYARMTTDQRAIVARSLRGYEDANGFLVVEPLAPLGSVDLFDGAAMFGDGELLVMFVDCTADITYGTGQLGVIEDEPSPENGYSVWLCAADGRLTVIVSGDEAFRAAVGAGLEVSVLPES